MYGNFEYGSIPYGDATSAIILITRAGIEVIFISALKQSTFISSEPSITIFISATKTNKFASERKTSLFHSLRKNTD